jgi:hypothetical protein
LCRIKKWITLGRLRLENLIWGQHGYIVRPCPQPSPISQKKLITGLKECELIFRLTVSTTKWLEKKFQAAPSTDG